MLPTVAIFLGFSWLLDPMALQRGKTDGMIIARLATCAMTAGEVPERPIGLVSKTSEP